MDLRQHAQDELHEEEEISGAEPGYASIAHLRGELPRHLVKILFGFLLLLVVASVALLLLLHVLYIVVRETCMGRLLSYYFEEAKRRGQVP